MTDLQIEDLNPILARMLRRTRRRSSRMLQEAERRHEQFFKDLTILFSDSAEKDRTQN